MEEQQERQSERLALTEPTKELAEKITRKVPWESRIEGSTFDPGPGSMVQRIYKLEEVYNLIKAIPNFSIDYLRLQNWIGEVLGDSELAEKLEEVLSQEKNQRETITQLLALRLNQCKKVAESA